MDKLHLHASACFLAQRTGLWLWYEKEKLEPRSGGKKLYFCKIINNDNIKQLLFTKFYGFCIAGFEVDTSGASGSFLYLTVSYTSCVDNNDTSNDNLLLIKKENFILQYHEDKTRIKDAVKLGKVWCIRFDFLFFLGS